MTAFVARIFTIVPALIASFDSMIGSISSEVDMNTAMSTPAPITPPLYRLDAISENPHCGTIPSTPPINGPSFSAFPSTCACRPAVFLSSHSMTT